MSLPKAYAWLVNEPAPKMLIEALKLFGVRETNGAGNTPAIMGWARELGGDVARVYSADSIPWCGLFAAIVARRAGKSLPASPLWARAWASWGDRSPRASLGDVLVFVRPGGGHVGLYVGEDAGAYHVLGGNQGDAVSITRIAKSRCIAARRSYTIAAPPNVRPVRLAATGRVSKNEA
jgi:uncharacterized protein (TIGR02594 family)